MVFNDRYYFFLTELKCEEVNGCVLCSIMCDMVKTFVSKLHSDGVFNYNRLSHVYLKDVLCECLKEYQF